MKRDKIRTMYKACSAELTSRTNEIQHLLLGEGNEDAKVLIIAEMPSAKEEEYNQNILDEDREKLLEILQALDLTIDDVYLTHLMKYRPFRFNAKGHIVSRPASKEELSFFMPYLEKEISLINPKLIITLGNEPLRWLAKDDNITVDPSEDQLLVVGVHGKSYKLYPIAHPSTKAFNASLLRFEEDRIRINGIVNEGQMSVDELSDIKAKLAKTLAASKKAPKEPAPESGSDADILRLLNSGGLEDEGVIMELSSKPDTAKAGSAKADIKKAKADILPGSLGASKDVAKNFANNVSDEEIEEYAPKREGKQRLFEKIKITGDSKKAKKKRSYITVVYGGEGFIDDPVLVAIERVSHVFTELEIGIHRIDLHKGKISMAKAFEYIAESRGVVFGVGIEWFGIGHRMQKFLDECFYHGDETYFRAIPLLAICLTRQAFEKEAYQHLLKSWQILGGREGVSIEGIVKNAAALETNFDWLYGIDKKAEQYFRIMQQDKGLLPTSGGMSKVEIEVPVGVTSIKDQLLDDYNPVEKPKDQPSTGIIEDYDMFVEKQNKDIQNISSLFKKKLSSSQKESVKELPQILKEAYVNTEDVEAIVQISFDDLPRENTVIELNGRHIRTYFGQKGEAVLTISSSKEILNRIFTGKLTMQRGFMTGEVKAKGDFTLIYKFEDYFKFKG